ncbi:hypothetical protein [Actinopolymorpha alba]|uniref:hypothetical protein n=1 Tax=Actinopolymorpha alba TaxID=533267 RepID=UPI000372F34C|nr:hypothetical protein [Actinopolymorpha alba]
MSPRRGDRVAPRATKESWDVRFGSNDAAKGWEDLCPQAAGNTAWAYFLMRDNPAPAAQSPRHQRLKGPLSTGRHHDGRSLPQWQIEVTSKGRVWYLLDADNNTVWVVHASTKHPKITE